MEKQLSIFDWMPEAVPVQDNRGDDLMDIPAIILKAGPSIEDGIYRIAKAIEDDRLSPEFLSAEYGVGGKAVNYDEHDRTWIDYSPKGIRVFRRLKALLNREQTDLIPWKTVLSIWKEAYDKKGMNMDKKKYLEWCKKYSDTYGPAQNVWRRG
ncbi:MAG: hypothetical protein MJ097_00555 [Dorea sp.]|nr:hypothetical protein [Dorea sp.]